MILSNLHTKIWWVSFLEVREDEIGKIYECKYTVGYYFDTAKTKCIAKTERIISDIKEAQCNLPHIYGIEMSEHDTPRPEGQ